MSSTKRKQIKPQKIFNSKKIDSISANNILQQQETSTNWRVITDLSSSSSSSSPPSSTTTSMKESKHSIESQLNNNNNHNLSQLVNNDYFNHFLYQQAIADSATCMNPNLMQSIEKIILMNLTPYLFGMINNQQQQQQHQQFETYSSAFSTVNQNNTETINNFKKKNDLLCSCGTSFDSFEILNQHLKQTNHKMIEVKSNQNDYIFNNNNSKNKINNSKHDHKSLFSSASSSVCLSPSQSPVTPTTIATTNKMVRGQEEWVKNSRDNNFISQILKCLECSASFDTLADLSLHMLNTNHFSKFHNNNNQLQNINNLTTITNNRTNKSNNESINHVSSQSSSSSSSNKQHYKRSEQQPQANLFNNTSNVGCRLKNSITNQSDLKCLICNKKFDNNNNNNNNKSSSTELPPLVKLIQHLQNAHKVTNVCTNCGAIFNNTDDLQKHLLEESYHHYHNNIQNINSSLTNKNLKRNNNNNNNNSSNSNLNIHKKIKSTCETSSSSSPTTLTPPLALPVENDFINNLKLNLFLNKQNEYNSSKQTTSNSISPSSSSTSSSYSSSSNSSSPSFLISSGNNETNLSNFKDKIESHPLLALQMFVNNSNSTLTENKTKVKQQQQQQYQYSIPPPPPLMPNESVAAAAAAAATATHKLPAKKRPYIEESLSNEEEEEDGEGEGKNNNLFKLFKNNNNNNYKRSVEDLNNTLAKENKKCHSPLNLLQKMQIGLDDYLMR